MCLRPEWGTITSIPSELRNYIGALLGVSYQRLLTSRCTDFPMVLCPNPIIPWEPSAVLSRGRELPKAQVNRLGYEKMCNSIADDIHPDSQDPRVNQLRTALFTGKCFWFKVQRPVIFGRKESGSNTENTQNDEGGVQTVILVYKHSSKQTLTNTCNIYQPLPRCISPASPPLYLGRESVGGGSVPKTSSALWNRDGGRILIPKVPSDILWYGRFAGPFTRREGKYRLCRLWPNLFIQETVFTFPHSSVYILSWA